jgi:hypothetical protein
MTSSSCARCASPFEVGDQVVDVRKVTRIYTDNGTLATDRGDAVAHLECPPANLENRSQ